MDFSYAFMYARNVQSDKISIGDDQIKKGIKITI